MSTELIQKLENSIENLKTKKAKIYFFVQDTKGHPASSIRFIYNMALTLKNDGHEAIILHEKNDYYGVQNWLGDKYMQLPHLSVENQKLQVSPEDTLIVPEIFGYIMSQVANLPCAKIVLCQAYDYIFETLEPGQSWAQLGFSKCITVSENMKSYISLIMKGVSIDVIEPSISDKFEKSKYPPKPIVAIHCREQRDSLNLIKNFYLKFPQYRWVSFRDMRGMPEEEFANYLKECVLSVWIDDISSFGTFPIESMKCGVPVIGKVPRFIPAWLNENNGIWINDFISLTNFIADFLQNWFEDNISSDLYENMKETADKFSNHVSFERDVLEKFQSYTNLRLTNFEKELNKQLEEQTI